MNAAKKAQMAKEVLPALQRAVNAQVEFMKYTKTEWTIAEGTHWVCPAFEGMRETVPLQW
jgi:hypothetical protein